jgi:NAD dependent epimerase/dehydratase family
MAKRKVLVAGASGLVGQAAVRHFAAQPECEVVAVSRRVPDSIPGAKFLSVDLLDPQRCAEVFGQMGDVTQLVYAAVNEKPGLMDGWLDRAARTGREESAARLVVTRDQGVWRSSGTDRDTRARALTASRSSELLLAAGGLSASQAAGQTLVVDHPATAIGYGRGRRK